MLGMAWTIQFEQALETEYNQMDAGLQDACSRTWFYWSH